VGRSLNFLTKCGRERLCEDSTLILREDLAAEKILRSFATANNA
jgi:hypothetical protein